MPSNLLNQPRIINAENAEFLFAVTSEFSVSLR